MAIGVGAPRGGLHDARRVRACLRRPVQRPGRRWRRCHDRCHVRLHLVPRSAGTPWCHIEGQAACSRRRIRNCRRVHIGRRGGAGCCWRHWHVHEHAWRHHRRRRSDHDHGTHGTSAGCSDLCRGGLWHVRWQRQRQRQRGRRHLRSLPRLRRVGSRQHHPHAAAIRWSTQAPEPHAVGHACRVPACCRAKRPDLGVAVQGGAGGVGSRVGVAARSSGCRRGCGTCQGAHGWRRRWPVYVPGMAGAVWVRGRWCIALRYGQDWTTCH